MKKRNIENATYTILDMLNKYPSQAYPAKIAEFLGLNRSSASRRFKTMEMAGLIRQTLRTSTSCYELTEQGKALLKVVRKVVPTATSVFRWHHLIFKLPIVNRESQVDFEYFRGESWKEKRRGILHGFEAKIEGEAVFFCGESFLVYPKPIHAQDFHEAIEKGLTLGERIGRRLEELFPKIKLHYRMEVCRQQMAVKGGWTKWIPEGYSFAGDRLLVDFSTGEAEVESFGKFTVEGMSRVARFLDRIASGVDEEKNSVLSGEDVWRDRS